MPFEKLSDIGKVAEFEYVVTTASGKTVTNKLYVQTELTGTQHGWNPTTPTQPTTILENATDVTAASTLTGSGYSTVSTPNLTVTNYRDEKDLAFTITSPYDVFSFTPATTATGLPGSPAKPITYEIIDVNDSSKVFVVESDFYTISGNSVREVRDIPVGSYVLRIKPGSTSIWTAEAINLSVKQMNWASPAQSGQIPNMSYSTFNVRLSVDGKPVTANGTVIDGDYGNLTVNTDGSFSYQAMASYSNYDVSGKSESFKYTITAPNGDTEEAYIHVDLTGSVTPIAPANGVITRNYPAPTTGASLPFSFSLGDGSLFVTPQVSFNQDDE